VPSSMQYLLLQADTAGDAPALALASNRDDLKEEEHALGPAAPPLWRRLRSELSA
jgi:hypothetical protein